MSTYYLACFIPYKSLLPRSYDCICSLRSLCRSFARSSVSPDFDIRESDNYAGGDLSQVQDWKTKHDFKVPCKVCILI